MADQSDIRRMFDIVDNELDRGGNRVLTVELGALLTHPDDVRRALKRDDPFELSYTLTQGEHKKVGSIDPKRPRFRLLFEKGADPHGVWEMVIEAHGTSDGWSRQLWRQFLFVQTKLRRSSEQIDELARKYAPVFVFSGAEKYFPVSLHTLLEADEVLACEDSMKLKTFFGKESIPTAQLGEFMRFNGHADYLLDFNFLSMRRTVFAKLGGDPRNATVYYSYLEDPNSERFFINYHLIYAFDTKAGIAKLTGIGPHVFDRESMVMVFEADERPSSMIISGHLENQTISFLEKLKSWTQGRLRVRFDDERTLKMGTHPVVAVAEGSHALYPTSGVYQLSLLRELAGYLDPKVMLEEDGDDDDGPSTISPEQILSPPSLRSEAVPRYHLRAFGLDQLSSRIYPVDTGDSRDPFSSFLVFSGFWVDVPGTRNARFPPFTRKVNEIVDWVDDGYTWEWDDVPERYHRNNGIILGFLRENLEEF
jgi:hypothetical protein